jgi:GT2 family glycosyltransferase
MPDVILLENTRNDGYAGGNNLGIDAALQTDPDAVFILNNDAEVRPGCIQTLAAALAADPVRMIAGPLSRRRDDPGLIDFYRAEIDLPHLAVHALLRDSRETPPSRIIPTDYATGSAMLIRADFLRGRGPFDERFYLVWEDVDLCLRARTAGGDRAVVAVPEAEVIHARSVSFGGDGSPLFRYFEVRNSFLLVAKHLRGLRLARTKRLLRRRYEGWMRKPDTPASTTRAIEAGLRDGLAGRFGPPPDEMRAL